MQKLNIYSMKVTERIQVISFSQTIPEYEHICLYNSSYNAYVEISEKDCKECIYCLTVLFILGLKH